MVATTKKSRFAIVCCSHRVDYFNRNVAASLPSNPGLLQLILVQNEENRYSIPQALNLGLDQANAEFVIFCHHDVVFPENWLETLEGQIALIDTLDKEWGVLGVMGVGDDGKGVGSIEDPYSRRKLGQLPSSVQSLDEVCLIVRSDAGFRFDEDLGGFHLYGADICLQSWRKGKACYGIDAPIKHLSAGTMDNNFYEVAAKLKHKWSRVRGSPYTIETTCGVFALRHNFLVKIIAAIKIFRRRVCWGMGSFKDLKRL